MKNRQGFTKKLAAALLVLVMAISGFGAMSAMAFTAGQSVVTITDMNFRNAPSGVKIGGVPEGARVTYNYSDGNWDNITYNSQTGWIYGGNLTAASTPSNETMTVVVTTGYLALRNAKAYDAANEIGKMYSGETVEVLDRTDSTYWYVRSTKLNQSGYTNCNYLVSTALDGAPTMTVQVNSGYLALRTGKAYDAKNEIGKLYTGDTVRVTDTRDKQYWYVYSPSLNKYGFVNKDYLKNSGTTGDTMYVRVSSGYLALRNAKAYDYNNEIGKLYTGDTVQVQDRSDSQYWYVYAPSLGKSGYVNKDYLFTTSGGGGGGSSTYTMYARVDSGYLALRNAKAFDYNNEIGKLYTGDSVQVQDTSDSQYWYVYAPSLGMSGYVNKDYLVSSQPSTGGGGSSAVYKTVSVDSGYLALRTAKAFDSSNEIGKLYTGDTVQVKDTSDSQYWLVYAPSLGKTGYVNKDYLY